METALILGTGWNQIVKQVKVVKKQPYSEVFKLKSTVPGHHGELIHAVLNDKPILIMSGRFHLYEGYTPEEVTN